MTLFERLNQEFPELIKNAACDDKNLLKLITDFLRPFTNGALFHVSQLRTPIVSVYDIRILVLQPKMITRDLN